VFNRILDRLEEWLIAFLMGAATLVIFVQVAHRYLSGMPLGALQDALVRINLGWAQELCIYMFVWMAKFGAAYGVRTGIHVGVDVLIRKLPEDKRRPVIVFGLLCGALFTGTIAVLGAMFDYRISQTDQVSADMEIPMWPVFLCIPLGSSLMCYRFLQVTASFLRTGELPHHDHGHVEGMDEVGDPILIGQAMEAGEAKSRDGGRQ
jgi:C4-dicarboxylate transporter DctQ subunit